jgi:hypothetical protein
MEDIRDSDGATEGDTLSALASNVSGSRVAIIIIGVGVVVVVVADGRTDILLLQQLISSTLLK